MLKLIRRYFAYHELHYKGNPIKWELIETLARKQDNDNFELGNKLSRDHINFKEAPMKVSLAAETISNSVADSLEQLCEDGYEEFIGCDTTVKFLRLNNNVFDVQNYGDGKPSDNHFKQSLCEASIGKFRELFHEYEEFISNLTVEEYKSQKCRTDRIPIRKPVLKSRSSVGFLGFLNNCTSILGIYTDYVENGPLSVFHNFQFSQDHLETYFSLIRLSLGWNNNPNETQFKSAYRKLLVCMPHLSARKTNCIINSTNILTISSAQQLEQQPSQLSFSEVEEIEIEEEIFHNLLDVEVDPYEKHMRAIIASNIEANIVKKISKQSLSACQDCLHVFPENQKIFDSLIAKKKQTKRHYQPCSSTIFIISACDLVFKRVQSEGFVKFHVLAKTIFTRLGIEDLYDSSLFHTHQNPANKKTTLTHKEQFIFDVILEYFNMKSKKIGKRITIEEQNGRAIRRNLTRTIILAGQ